MNNYFSNSMYYNPYPPFNPLYINYRRNLYNNYNQSLYNNIKEVNNSEDIKNNADGISNIIKNDNKIISIDDIKKDYYRPETEGFFEKKSPNEKQEESSKGSFRIGPATISKKGISIFGITLEPDDIIIIVLCIFLFLEKQKDYLLLIVLALILLDISLDTFKDLNILNGLFDAS